MTLTHTVNYLLASCRQSSLEEVEWARIEDLATLELPRPIVVVNGCFDILHSGHMKVLWAARERAGVRGTVVVAMDSDRRIQELKGGGHPVQSWVERTTNMNYMPIDLLVEFDTVEDLQRILAYLDPTVRIAGADYLEHVSASPGIPKAFVRDGGMRTSTIIKRCQDLLK